MLVNYTFIYFDAINLCQSILTQCKAQNLQEKSELITRVNLLNFILNFQSLKFDAEKSEESSIVNKAFSDLIASSYTAAPSAENCSVERVINYERSEAKWCFYYTSEQIDSLISSLNERGLRESDLKQNLLHLKSIIIEDLPHAALVKSLTMSDEEIEKSILISLKENASNVIANSVIMNTVVYKNNKRQLAKIQDAMQQVNNYATITSQEFLELDLKDKLLDIEEQIFIGSLGSLKVDRLRWRAALACNEYAPLCENLTWGGDQVRAALDSTNSNNGVKSESDSNGLSDGANKKEHNFVIVSLF